MTQTLSGLNIHEDMYAARVQESQSTVKSLQKDIEDQKTKRDRVLRQCSKLQKEIRTKKGVPPHQQTEEEVCAVICPYLVIELKRIANLNGCSTIFCASLILS